MTAHALNVLDATSWLSSLGALGVLLVVFAETGLLIGFFLPGDSLLFTAGLFCTTSSTNKIHLSLPAVLACAAVGAVAGAQTGFWLGARAGRGILARSRNRHFIQGVERAESLLERYGQARAIMIGRFIPVVRTILNPLAGALEVPVRTFTIWQVAGGLIWSVGVTLAGYGLGSSISGIDTYLLPIIAAIVVVSLIPLALELRRSRGDGGSPAADRGPVGGRHS